MDFATLPLWLSHRLACAIMVMTTLCLEYKEKTIASKQPEALHTAETIILSFMLNFCFSVCF